MTSSLVGLGDVYKRQLKRHSECTECTSQLGRGSQAMLPNYVRRLRSKAVSYTHLTLPTICSV
eukprot:6132957-Prorocentrum_lima.AAC.1